jgi:Putative transposase
MRKSCICPTQDTADTRPLIQSCSTPSAGFFMTNVPLAARTKATWLSTHSAPRNQRIIAIDAKRRTVTFTYRDYLHGSQLKELTLSVLEFIRRFSSHILPSGLVRIRHYESSATMVKNKPNRPLNQSCQQGCAHPRQTTFDNISSFTLRDC